MMKFKNFFIILLLILLVLISTTLVMGNVLENNDFSEIIEDNVDNAKSFIGFENPNEPKDKYQVVTTNVSSYTELKNVITNYTKSLDNRSYIINLNDGDYNITDTFRCGDSRTDSQFTINGNGHILDGQNKHQFMELHANLKLKDLTIQNTIPGESNSSGTITMQSVSDLYIENCNFINNKGKVKGSVITNRGTAYITGSTFINNSVEETGGAIWSIGEYGGSLNINNCIFEGNSANSNLNNDRTAIIYMVTYGNNTIENNQFIKNKGRCIHSFNQTNTKIIGNSFSENSMIEDDVIRGGIIDNYESDMIIKNNEFNNDKTIGELRGGILYHEIGNLEFTDNKINDYNINYDPTSTSLCSKGGVIFNRNATMNIKNNIFNNRLVGNYSRGGVIYNNNGEITLMENTFNNVVEGEKIRGLTIYNDVNSKINLGNNTFESKNKGTFEAQNEDKYIFNSKIPNEEGSGTIGLINYLS